MTDASTDSKSDDNSAKLSDIISFDTLSLDSQSFKSVSLKSVKSNSNKLKNVFTSIKEKILNVTDDILKKLSGEINNFVSKYKKRKSENDFLGYYECLNTSELLNPKISLSTARINLHEGESVDEAKNLIITKIKNAPYVKNVSLFIIPGKGNHNNSSNNRGILNKSLPEWLKDDSIKGLVDGEPIKGNGTYEVFIKRISSDEINNNFCQIEDEIIKEWEKNAKKNDDINYIMALAGYYMKGPKENHNKAEFWYKKAEKLGSIEAKLCLGYMHSIGKRYFDPKKAKGLFKEVISKLENSNDEKDKELCKIAMRNMAHIYHNSHLIRPLELKNFAKITKISDLKVSKLNKVKLKIAIRWYEKSCKLGDSRSAYNLGLLYEGDKDIKKDDGLAEYFFRKAVELDNNNSFAREKLGKFLINKEDVDEKAEGYDILKKFASIGLE